MTAFLISNPKSRIPNPESRIKNALGYFGGQKAKPQARIFFIDPLLKYSVFFLPGKNGAA
jgi:hypothetical protein